MSYSNFDGDFQYWTNNPYNDDPSSAASSQFNHGLFDTTPTYTHQTLPAIDMEAARKGEKKLGLKLTKTESLLNIMDGFKDSRSKNNKQLEDDYSSNDKLKAANFPALSIQIGSWKRESRYEGDLVAKCYFKKRKLVWEALDGNLKTKIEFLWSNILAIKQTDCHASQTRILEIMLERSPVFFREVNPQPRKHTNWEQSDDFTSNNQASLVRKHVLEFAPGILEKNFDKIIQADPKLQRLSQQPWPKHISPYFHEIRFTNEYQPVTFLSQYSSYNPTNDQGIGNYPIHDAPYNLNASSYQNFEQGGVSNAFNNQSEYYTSSTDLGHINQHDTCYGQGQELSYETSFPYSYANSNSNDAGYYQSNNNDDDSSQYYDNLGGNQWN